MEALHESVKIMTPFPPAERSAATTLYNNAAIGDAVGIDTRDFDEALISVQTGVVGATTLDVTVGFSDTADADHASFALLSGAAFAQVVNANDNKTYVIRISTQDTMRYMFVKTVQADAVAVNYAVTVALGKADVMPVTQLETVAFEDESAA